MLKKGLYFLFLLFLTYVFIGFIMAVYAIGWMMPQADKAEEEIKRRITPGVTFEEIKKLADELHASKFEVVKINEHGEERVRVQFNRFPGGISRNGCFIFMSNKIATSLQCWYAG